MAIPGGFWLLALSLIIADTQLSLQITPLCSSEQHYEHSGRCCTKCEPGKYMKAKCTATSETVCHFCGPNEYMDAWNEEEKCLLHKICDQGKALIEVNPGNSTNQRQCACTAGYHWNEDCDCCRRNTKCPLGFGVKHPVQEDKNTVCIPCPTGYFSNISSSTDECKAWTNCTALRAAEKNPGTDRSDTICETLLNIIQSQDETNIVFYLLMLSLLLVALVGIAVLAVYYRKKGKALTDIQYWANEICKQIKGTKTPPRDAFLRTNVASPAGLRLLEGTYLLDLDECSFSEDACYSNGHNLCGKFCTDKIHYELGEHILPLPLVAKLEDCHLGQIPTEDEYTDRIPQDPCSRLSPGQRDSTLVSPSFSEPLEVGENDSLSQCFTGTESLMTLTNCCCSELSCDSGHTEAVSDQCVQNWGHCCTCNGRRDADSEDLGTPEGMSSCTNCRPSCRGSPRKLDIATYSLKESGPPPLCTSDMDSSYEEQSNLASNTGAGRDPSNENNVQHQNAESTYAESHNSTSDVPTATGNVTGDRNSTFVSSGQVMNFKGDIIVVYVSQNSQEGSASPGSPDDNLGSPVQEENLNRCETFAGNIHQYKEKYAEVNSYHFIEKEELSLIGEYKRLSEEENQACQKWKHFGHETSQPVQEEGKPGWLLEKELD